MSDSRLEWDSPENQTQQLIADYKFVIEAAKKFDHAALAAYVQHRCIDVRWGEKTPVLALANMGHVEAAEFLMNNFGASYQEAITGYALAGNIKQVNSLLKRGAFLLDAIRGYARGGISKECERLCSRAEFEFDQPTYVECLAAALEGYASGGYDDKVTLLLDRIKSISGFDNDVLDRKKKIAVQGHRFTFHRLAHRGYYNLLFFCPHMSHFEANRIRVFYSALNSGFTPTRMNNYTFAAYAILDRLDLSIHAPTKIKLIVRAAAYAGRFKLVEDLVSRYGYGDAALFGYGAGGHAKQVDHLVKCGLDAIYAIGGYLRYGHIRQAENLILRTECNHSHFFNFLYVGGYLSNKDILLRTLSQFTNRVLRIKLINWLFDPKVNQHFINMIKTPERSAIQEFYNYCDKLSGEKPTLESLTYAEYMDMRSTKLCHLMRDAGVNYAQAIAWMNPAFRAWMIDGGVLVKKGMPRDVFNIITAHAFSLSLMDVLSIHEKLCIPLFKRLLEKNLEAYVERINSASQDQSLSMFLCRAAMSYVNLTAPQINPIEKTSVHRIGLFLAKLKNVEEGNQLTMPMRYAATLHQERAEVSNALFPQAPGYIERLDSAIKRL